MGLLQEQASQIGIDDDHVTSNVDALLKQATKILYGDNFDAMVKTFQSGGKEEFHQTMSTAINAVLQRLGQENRLDPMTAAKVGIALFEMILQDMIEGGVIKDIDKQSVLMAIEYTLRDWMKANPDQNDPGAMKRVIEQMAQQMNKSGQLEDDTQIVPPSQMGQMG